MSTEPSEKKPESEAAEPEQDAAAPETEEHAAGEAETEETAPRAIGWGSISPDEAAAAAQAAGTADEDAAIDAAAEMALRVPELEAEVAALKDKLLRAVAEAENVRRRTQREKEDASKYAIANFAREMLGVADNLRRALDSVDAEARAGNEALEGLAVGVEMTEREMLGAMERVGIRPIEALGKRFDHNFHEAMFEIEDPSQPAGTVLQEIQSGYMLGERLLRPSRVGMSRGGPKEAPAPAEDGETGDGEPASKDPYDQKPDASGTTLDEEL